VTPQERPSYVVFRAASIAGYFYNVWINSLLLEAIPERGFVSKRQYGVAERINQQA